MSDKANSNLQKAKRAKNDEFYTQYADIEKEVSAYLEFNPDVFRDKTILLPCDDPDWSNFTKYFVQNFEAFGIKELISTSYSPASRHVDISVQLSADRLNDTNTDSRGKIFTLSREGTNPTKIDKDNLKWEYLTGDGDFRSYEISALRDEADIIITNPPFSLFREFLAWVFDAGKLFTMIGNKNAVTYKELFPLIKANKIWSGRTEWSGGMWFETINTNSVDKVVDGIDMKNVASIWFTNIEQPRPHQPLRIMSMNDNLKYNSKVLKNKADANSIYQKYDNYDAIEVSYTNAIPSDYNGVMGVPISFSDKYCPEQFEILGATESEGRGFSMGLWDKNSKVAQAVIHDKRVYKRIFISQIRPDKSIIK